MDASSGVLRSFRRGKRGSNPRQGTKISPPTSTNRVSRQTIDIGRYHIEIRPLSHRNSSPMKEVRRAAPSTEGRQRETCNLHKAICQALGPRRSRQDHNHMKLGPKGMFASPHTARAKRLPATNRLADGGSGPAEANSRAIRVRSIELQSTPRPGLEPRSPGLAAGGMSALGRKRSLVKSLVKVWSRPSPDYTPPDKDPAQSSAAATPALPCMSKKSVMNPGTVSLRLQSRCSSQKSCVTLTIFAPACSTRRSAIS